MTLAMTVPAFAWDWVGDAPRAGEKYYIYNVARGGFLKGGTDKLVGKNGAPSLWTFTTGEADASRFTVADADGYRITCEIQAEMALGTGAFSTSKKDGAEELILTKVSQHNGSYTISYIGQTVNIGTYYMTVERPRVFGIPIDDYQLAFSRTNPNTNSYWKFISEEEFAADHTKNTITRSNDIVTAQGTVTIAQINNYLVASDKALYVKWVSNLSGANVQCKNPNMLIYARDNQVGNGANVVVDHVCTNMMLQNTTSQFGVPEWFTATNAEYNMTTIAGGKFGTLMLPFDATTISNPSCEIYAVTADINVSGGDIYGTKKMTLEANKPAIVTSAAKFSASNVVVNKTSNSHTSGFLTGIYRQIDAPVGSYVLQNHNDVEGSDDNTDVTGVAFYVVRDVRPKVNPFRAYIEVPEGTNVKALKVHLGDETTDIQDAFGVQSDPVVYDLSGRRVNNPTRGIYVVNGKKVLKR